MLASSLLFSAHWPLATRIWFLDFRAPFWQLALWLLATLVPTVYFWATSRIIAGTFRRAMSLALRICVVLALVFALADTHIVWSHRGICVIFLLDQSDSIPATSRMLLRDQLADEIKNMTADDQFAVIEFGGDAVLESLPGKKGEFPAPVQVPDTHHTDIARAIRLATATFPADHQKRIVLLTDGNQNSGDALREARIAAANDVDIDTILLHADDLHDVMVQELIAPPRVQKDQTLNVRAVVNADQAQSAKVSLLRDGDLLAQKDVQLKAGTNIIDMPDSISRGGFHNYEFTVIPSGDDAFPENNRAETFTHIQENSGRVLVVQGQNVDHDFISDALAQNHVPVDTGGEERLPNTAIGLLDYDVVVLEDVNAARIGPARMEALRRWVEDSGGGLVLVGGTDSFGPGGYKDTPLEAVSPVEMDVKRKKHLASLALCIVLDKSGSMAAAAGGGTNLCKLDLANAGSAETLKLLDETDLCQVGAVDTEVWWMTGPKLVPMTPANKRIMTDDLMADRVGGGGIYCKTALDHAYELVTAPDVGAMSKHVILFADAADSEQQEGCIDLADKMFRQNHVTTSVIGLGEPTDPDVPFQKELAKTGHGRWYITNDAMALPRFFAKEAFIASRNAFVEKKEGFAPTLYQSPLLEGFTGKQGTGVPPLFGYVGTTLKARATLAAHGLEPDDPVIAHWVVGLGKCVAFTSDATAHWGTDWVKWEGFSKFWTQTIRWVARSKRDQRITTTTTVDDSGGHIVVQANDAQGNPINNLDLGGVTLAPDQTRATQKSSLVQVAPGRYEGHFAANDQGTYLVNITEKNTGGVLDTNGAVLSYPIEFRDLTPNAALLHALSETSGGQFLDSTAGIFAAKPKPVQTSYSLWEPLLVFAAASLFFDIAQRRLNFADWFARDVRQIPMGAAGQTLGAFKSVKTSQRDIQKQKEDYRRQLQAAAAQKPLAELNLADSPAKSYDPAAQVAANQSPAPGNAEEPRKSPSFTNSLLSAKKRAAEKIKDRTEQR